MHREPVRIVGLLIACTSFLAGCSATTGVEPTSDPTTEQTDRPSVETTQAEVETEDALAPNQTVEYSIAGGCLDSYETVGYYGIFEEFGDDCFLVVEVFPPEPSRLAELQYFETTWVTESSVRTDSTGIAYLEVDPICEGGVWCDGVWEYRIFLDEESGLPADRSLTFELDFLPHY